MDLQRAPALSFPKGWIKMGSAGLTCKCTFLGKFKLVPAHPSCFISPVIELTHTLAFANWQKTQYALPIAQGTVWRHSHQGGMDGARALPEKYLIPEPHPQTRKPHLPTVNPVISPIAILIMQHFSICEII